MCNPEFRTIGNLPAFFGIIGTLPVVCEGSDPRLELVNYLDTIGKCIKY
jgi:hypothetical protein